MTNPGFIKPRFIRILSIIIVLWTLLLCMGSIHFAYHPHRNMFMIVWVFCSLPLSFMVPILALIGFIDFIRTMIKSKEISRQVFRSILLLFIPIVVAILCIFLNGYVLTLNQKIRDNQFQKKFGEFQKVVDIVKEGNATENTAHFGLVVPEGLPVDRIEPRNFKNSSGQEIIHILFFSYGKVPGITGGYEYISDENEMQNIIRESLLNYRQIKPNWYYFSE